MQTQTTTTEEQRCDGSCIDGAGETFQVHGCDNCIDSPTRTKLVRARDWSAFMQMTRREQDAFLAEQWFADTAEPFDPGYDDFEPTGIDLDQNAGPALVDICHDFSSDTEYGYAGRVECWPIEATVNSPQWSEVA